jgi:hypothetical protein
MVGTVTRVAVAEGGNQTMVEVGEGVLLGSLGKVVTVETVESNGIQAINSGSPQRHHRRKKRFIKAQQ